MGDNTNNQNGPIEDIRSAFGLIEGEYRIERKNFFHEIKPAKKQQLEINVRIENVDIFNQYYLIFENCKFKEEVFFNNQTFLHQLKFRNCTFLDAHFSGATFKEEVSFCGSTFKKKEAVFSYATFEKWVDFSGGTLQWVNFAYATFKKGANFSKATFRKWVDFSHATFEKKTNFSGAKFEEEADISDMELTESEKLNITLQKGEAIFSNATFKEEANFRSVTFHQDVRFNDARFQNEQAFFSHATFQQVSFRGSIFDGNAYFFEAKFLTIPDFLQVSFNKNINFTNTELDFEFEDAKEKIKEIYKTRKDKYEMEQNKEDKEYKEEPKEYRIANEFRDSFRTIKSALIKDNNMLDASNYHRAELYCKEIELEYRNSGLRDFVDRIQLYCYRLTSDHHTNLMLILNNVIFLIALFGVANLVLLVSQCDIIQLAFLKINYIKLLEVSICIIYVSLIVCIMLNRCSIIHFVIFLPIFSLVFYLHSTYVIFMVLTFCVLILYLMLLSCFQSKLKENLVKQCIFGISYFIVILMFIFKPSLLIPILGKLIEDKSSKSYCCDDFDIFECCLNTTSFASETLNLIYMLLLFLLLFSLQKTARKNTIVPN